MKINGVGNGSSNGSHHQQQQSFRKQSRRLGLFNPTQVITLVLFSITSFYCGTLMGWSACSSSQKANSNPNCEEVCKQKMMDNLKLNASTDKCNTSSPGTSKRFSPKLSHWAAGLVSINRKDLFDTYDFGVPMDSGAENQNVLMLYNEKKAMPNNRTLSRAAENNGDIPQTTAKEATENCVAMSVVFIKNPDSRIGQCVALVGGQYQGYHVQRWQRLIGEGSKGKTDRSAPLRLTSRMTNGAGYDEFLLPKKLHLDKHEAIMTTYFNSLSKIRRDLGAILKKIAVNNSVVVMTVNKGQSELLMNFACSARARGFNIDNLIVFPTDMFSKDLAEGLGLATYYSNEVSVFCGHHRFLFLCHEVPYSSLLHALNIAHGTCSRRRVEALRGWDLRSYHACKSNMCSSSQ